MHQLDLERDFLVYPDGPGFKARETSRDAAAHIAPRAGTIRDRVYAAIKAYPGTPEEIARRIGEKVMNVRPRCSELARQQLIVDSGTRRKAMGGRMAIVWAIAAAEQQVAA